jgi:hypothetical protein
MEATTVSIITHSRDCHTVSVYSKDKMIYEHDGYAPYFVNCAIVGEEREYFDVDDIHFEIDVETGKIVNWNADLFKKHLAKQIKKADFLTIYKKAKKGGDCIELAFADAFGGDKQLFDFIFNNQQLNEIFKQLWKSSTPFNVNSIGEYEPEQYWSDELAEEIFFSVSTEMKKKIAREMVEMSE